MPIHKDQDGLTDKQRLFAQEYLVDLNATQAAIRAGYSARSARQSGVANMQNPSIIAAIHQAMDDRSRRLEMEQDEVLRELAALARSDMADFLSFGKDGEVYLDWSQLPRGATKLIREITQEVFTEGRGEDAREVRRTKFKLHDKLSALKLVGQHLGLFKTNVKLDLGERHVKRIIIDAEGDDEA